MVGEIEKKGGETCILRGIILMNWGERGDGRRRVKTEDEKNAIRSYVFKFKEHYTYTNTEGPGGASPRLGAQKI